MKEENEKVLKTQGADADVEDIVSQAQKRQAEEQARQSWGADEERMLQARAAEMERVATERRRKYRNRAVSGAMLFTVAACAVLAGMYTKMVDPWFAIPLAVIWFCRAAVRYDRYARRWK